MIFPAIKVLEGYFIQEPEKKIWKGVSSISLNNFFKVIILYSSCCVVLNMIIKILISNPSKVFYFSSKKK